ncbi:hypothetical protein [Nocardia sp. NPDC050435]|uniref:hypothetical protein n=1 Tax=Nocardia sp. NPDC050435 TaxID=3155040 RepID=UPI003408E383
MPQLNTYVHVQDHTGENHEFGPGSEIPAWAASAITNPDVWEIPPATVLDKPDSLADEPETAKRAPRKATAKASG